MKHRSSFTLIELLAVIALILILMSLLLPVMGSVRERANILLCQTVIRNIGTAALLYAGDMNGRLPPSVQAGAYIGPPPYTNAWIGSEAVEGLGYSPSAFLGVEGALAPYLRAPVGPARSFYRCPSLAFGGAAAIGSGQGSNGAFDYTMYGYTCGALVSQLPRSAELVHPLTGQRVRLPAPLYTEEDPAYGINDSYRDPDHISINRMGSWHGGQSCNYFSIDGSVQRVIFGTAPGPQAYDWYTQNARGTAIRIGNLSTWDCWNTASQW
jgi:type II secretory pathway pseudopilin PulG